MEKFLLISGLNICCDGKKSESEYIKGYVKSVTDTARQKDWKTTGDSARFQGRFAETPDINARITGVSPYSDTGYIYCAATGTVSGILKKDYADGTEQYLVHDNKYTFSGVNYVAEEDIILASAGEDNQTAHIARYDNKENNLQILTSGDALDQNPSYSDGKILFDSRGAGRNQTMQLVGYGAASLYELDKDNACNEILAEEGFDLIAPKQDKDGNLYYIRKPYKTARQKSGIGILDILLFPFRLVANFFKLLFFLSNIGRKSDKKTSSNTAGANPAVTPGKSEKDLYIMDEMINLENEEKAAARKKDQNAGIAPARFELYKRAADGTATRVKQGVFAYDLADDGTVYYTNGKCIIKLQNGEETVLYKDKLITNFKLVK